MRNFQTTSEKRLNRESFPFRLYQKAKKFGTWDPKDIDFSRDQTDWAQLGERERKHTLYSVAQFIAGEEAVTLDLLPLIMAIAREGRLEEEMFLTTFLFEEAKHTEFFERFLVEVVGDRSDLSFYHSPSHEKIFKVELPASMERLLHDPSPEALAIAATTYNMIVEGVLAETGYHAFYSGLGKIGIMPGLMKGIGLLKTDESRHIAYGTYLLQRLISENGERILEVIARRMVELMPYCVGILKKGPDKGTAPKPSSTPAPFGLDENEFTDFAMKQLQVRMEILRRSLGRTMEELYPAGKEEASVLV
jgi:ribonucleoside-diphosphate reductase beta chain